MKPAILGATIVAALMAVVIGPGVAFAQAPGAPGGVGADVKPGYDIWSVKLGQPVTQIPERQVVKISCGTNGGPPSFPLAHFSDYAKCPAESSGLHEVYFQYDDEQEYIAKALDLDNPAMKAGTSMYAHPVIVSVLVDNKGIVRGIRVVTDQHASTYQRHSLFNLADNLRQRFASWKLDCTNIPRTPGQSGIGSEFVHFVCTGKNTGLGERLRIESRYYRRKGEEPIDPYTRKIAPNNFESSTRFELDQLPYKPSVPSNL